MKKTLSILGLSALGIAGVASLGSCSKEDPTESLDISINYTMVMNTMVLHIKVQHLQML